MAESKTILLVEDEALLAISEARILARDGYQVVLASSGADAIARVKSAAPPIDLILMDIYLGSGMDGIQAAQEILKAHDVPVLFLSSHSGPDVVERTEAVPSYGYVEKSTAITLLAASIRIALKLHAAQRATRLSNEKLRLGQEVLKHEQLQWVKTSLAMAASLLGLEEGSLPDERSRTIFTDMQARLQAIAAITEQLYRSGDIDRIDLRQFIEALAAGLAEAHLQPAGPVRITTHLEEVRLDPKRALPLGLILNELVAQALKHAFPGGKTQDGGPGTIRVELMQANGQVQLGVIHNGLGLPGDTQPAGGLDLVKMLTGQINGQFSIDSQHGWAARVTFPLA